MTTRKKSTTKKKTTKATSKTAAKKKTAVKKKTTVRKTAAKKTPAKKKKPASSKAKTAATKKTADKKEDNNTEADEERKATLKSYTKSKRHTPAVFKLPSKKNTPIVFSLEDVREALKKKQEDEPESKTDNKVEKKKAQPAVNKVSKTLPVIDEPQRADHSVLGAASISDILGFNPQAKANLQQDQHKNVPRKYMKYYKLLVELREHVLAGLDLHTQETLKRSTKDDSGDLSSYGQHMADAGTDNFDRDFALSLVSNEQEALYEVAEAIQRIHNGTYGICEITGQQISRERLEAVPFTRYSVEGQAELEKSSRKKVQRQGVFIDSTVEASVQFTDDDSD